MLKKIKLYVFILLITISLQNPAQAVENFKQKKIEFAKWLETFEKKLQNQAFTPTTLSYLKQAKLSPLVLELDQKQPEAMSSFWNYFLKRVNNDKIREGKKMMRMHAKKLKQAYDIYRVPPDVLVAFWGIETNYGSFMGTTSTIDALATLSFDLRRADLFENELIYALKLIQNKKVPAYKLKGSWAGALGNFQFLPSNYYKYGVDGDKNGKLDLFDSMYDAIYSAANLLLTFGWSATTPWGVEFSAPKNFAWNKYLEAEFTIAQWLKLGVQLKSKLPLSAKVAYAKIVLPAGYKGPKFLAFKNFNVIHRWNNSANYAISIGVLSDLLAGRRKTNFLPSPNRDIFSVDDLKAIQAKLQDLDYYEDEVDGVFGTNTKNALKDFQTENGLVADGFLDKRLFKKIISQ